MKIISRSFVSLAVASMLAGTALLSHGLAYADGKHRDRYYGPGRHDGHYNDRGYHYGHYKRYRPYGYYHRGYGYYHHDNDVWAWIAFGAITWAILDNLNDNQRRVHEQAQIAATSAPIGETIIWNQGGASGSVTPIRDGTSSSGNYCREFQHEVRVGGKVEQAYGTACRQPDGSWQILSTE
jgi:hypothetical protein